MTPEDVRALPYLRWFFTRWFWRLWTSVRKLWRNEFIIVIATILAYASIFQFEQGYASEFGVPEQLLQFELLQILSPVGYTAFVCASLIVMAPAIMMVISPSYLLRRRGIDWVNRLAMLFLLWIVVLQLAAVFGWMLIDTTSWIALAANEIGPKIGTIGFGALLAMIITTRFWPRIEGFLFGSTPPLSRFLGAFFVRVAILTFLGVISVVAMIQEPYEFGRISAHSLAWSPSSYWMTDDKFVLVRAYPTYAILVAVETKGNSIFPTGKVRVTSYEKSIEFESPKNADAIMTFPY
jgi:hypothetical protein